MAKKRMAGMFAEHQEIQNKRLDTAKSKTMAEKKVPLQIYFDMDDYKRLKKYSFEKDVKMAEAVRSWSLEQLNREGY